jgi:NAD(P)-dependent dehydrogenase (short-subunit alcohol dehydrogenase family)
MRVVITGRDRARGEEAEAKLRSFGNAWFIQADADDEIAIRASVDKAVELLGGIDALVNNAGVGLIASMLSTPVAQFDRLLHINLRAPLAYVQAAHPHLIERQGGVVNVASDAALRPEQAIGAYSVSKAALVTMSRLLALDLARDGIRCNCVCPGDTIPGMRHFGPLDDPESDGSGDPAEWTMPPLGRRGHAEDVAAAVLFFLGEESSFCSGTELLIDGGLQAGVVG